MINERTLKAVGFRVPKAFNADAHDSVTEKLGQYSQSHNTQWNSFGAAWNGLAYRFRKMVESHEAFASSIGVSAGPPPEERYKQECALFDFAMAAASSVECFFYALYCVGAIIAPTRFPMADDRDLRFYPRDVVALFEHEFPTEPLTQSIRSFLDIAQYKRAEDLRNVLAHRGVMLRRHFVGGDRHGTAAVPANPRALSHAWDYTQTLNPEVTHACMDAISTRLAESMDLAAEFISRRL